MAPPAERARSANEAIAEPKRNIMRAFPDQNRTGEPIGQDEGGPRFEAGAPGAGNRPVKGCGIVVTIALKRVHRSAFPMARSSASTGLGMRAAAVLRRQYLNFFAS